MKKIISILPLFISLLLACDVISGVFNDRWHFLAGENYTVTIGGVSFKMICVPGGTFPTGIDDLGGDQTISTPYWMSETEVTYELWDAVYTWATAHGYTFANIGRQGGDLLAGPVGTNQHPVTTINWRDAMVWCNALTEYYNANNGTDPDLDCVYYTNAGYTTPLRSADDTASVGSTPGDQDNPYVKTAAKGFRLPGSMEWECAVRYKDGTNWTAGDHVSGGTDAYTGTPATDYLNFNPFAWFGGVNNGVDGNTTTTHPVKDKTSNALGFYDMTGNMWEWCFDWHPSNIGSYRVYRGGCWGSGAINLRVGYVDGYYPYYEIAYIGFRFARSQ